jgi:hypothetical protein
MLPWESNKYSERLPVALVIQHAKCLSRITLSSVACLLYHIFPHNFKNSMSFGKKKVTEHTMHVLIFSTTFV